MNHKEKLLEIYENSSIVKDIKSVDAKTQENISLIGEKINSQKGVYTVMITLVTHKILHPEQDIRNHQSSMPNGFSGRTIDTQHITPTLKELGLPSMAESGWLTRSLEQPYPYTLQYNGKISNKIVKKAFLEILDYIQKNKTKSENVLRLILFEAIQAKKRSIVAITPLKNPEKITIEKIMQMLDKHFNTNYHTHGGSKLPVIAFYSIYKSLVKELSRYKGCKLKEMGSHTASDRTSKSAGDIEISKGKLLYEAIEIKLDKQIDANIVRIAIEKIKRYNPTRYYILSYAEIKDEEKLVISDLITEINVKHGCQIIINGIMPTIKYYLRLLTSLEQFMKTYSQIVERDTEIKKVHKDKLNELIAEFIND